MWPVAMPPDGPQPDPGHQAGWQDHPARQHAVDEYNGRRRDVRSTGGDERDQQARLDHADASG
jgi:hypothetical protein